MSQSTKNWLQFGGMLLLGLLLLWLAFRGVDLKEMGAEMGKARWGWIGLSLLLTLLGHLSRARRWQLLIQSAGYRVGIWACFVTMMTGYLSNLGIPRIGEVNRCVTLNRLSNAPVLALGGTVVAERAVDLITFAVLFVLTIFWMGAQAWEFFYGNFFHPLAAVMSWKLVVAGCLGVLLLLALNTLAFRRKSSEETSFRNKVQSWAREIWDGLIAALRLRKGRLAEFALHTFLIWVSYYAAPFCTLMALGVVSNDLAGLAFYIFVFGSLSRTIPLPAGSAGAYHFIVSQWMVFLGYSQLEGMSVATLNHAVQTLFYLGFGALGMLGFFVMLRLKPVDQSHPTAKSKSPTP
jgi:glycosyltransferase 2 family protein